MKFKTLSLEELYTHFILEFPGDGSVVYSIKNVDSKIFEIAERNEGIINILSSDKTKRYDGEPHNFYLKIEIENKSLKSVMRFEGNILKEKYKEYSLAYKENGILKIKEREIE